MGVLIGPYGWALIADPNQFALLAEFGVVFLLFTLGLEFNLSKMLSMKFMIFGLGSVQVIICTMVFALAVYLWGASFDQSILIAGALALSSTAVVTNELSQNHQIHSQYGRISVGVLLFQDLAAIVFLILVPVLAGTQSDHSMSIELLSALGRGVVLFALLMVVGKWVLPVIYREVSRSHSREIFVLTTLVIVLLAGWLTHQFHLSMALGGFITGVMLGEGSFRYQIEKDIQPFKDILMGLFFVSIGMALDVQLVIEYWHRIIGFTLALVVIKTLIVALVIKGLRYHSHDALRVGLTLAQAGEFGIALMALANTQGVIAGEQTSFIILIAILSMALSPFLIRYSNRFARMFCHQGESPNETGNVADIFASRRRSCHHWRFRASGFNASVFNLKEITYLMLRLKEILRMLFKVEPIKEMLSMVIAVIWICYCIAR